MRASVMMLAVMAPRLAVGFVAGAARRRAAPAWIMSASEGAAAAPRAAASRSFAQSRTPDELVAGAQKLALEGFELARATGARAAVQRTLTAQRALLETALELARDLPSPPPLRALVAAASRAGAAATAAPPGAADADAEAFAAWLAALPPELAPRTLRKLFERLGATYVKLGQFIASSPTLFPRAYVEEFQACLDLAPPVPYAEIRAVLAAELAPARVEDVFSSVEEAPLGVGSIAQVHAATLRATGEEVVVKVRKPGVAELLKADLGFLALATKAVEFVAPSLGRVSLAAVAADVRAAMLDELDFEKEAANLDAFGAFLDANGLRGAATCPRVVREHGARPTARALTMERLRGAPLVDLDGIRALGVESPEQTLVNALNAWALSVVACDSFHADVHAGNLLVLDDGRVGFIDFGIVGRIPPTTWAALNSLAALMVLFPPFPLGSEWLAAWYGLSLLVYFTGHTATTQQFYATVQCQ